MRDGEGKLIGASGCIKANMGGRMGGPAVVVGTRLPAVAVGGGGRPRVLLASAEAGRPSIFCAGDEGSWKETCPYEYRRAGSATPVARGAGRASTGSAASSRSCARAPRMMSVGCERKGWLPRSIERAFRYGSVLRGAGGSPGVLRLLEKRERTRSRKDRRSCARSVSPCAVGALLSRARTGGAFSSRIVVVVVVAVSVIVCTGC
jgi:hypothetical protein